jgi:hypothetical protein
MSSGYGHGLNKPANARYFTLRFPRVLKIYDDRSFKDTVSFEELQEMARQCREVSEDGKREEVHWLSRLRSLPVVRRPITSAFLGITLPGPTLGFNSETEYKMSCELTASRY